MKWDFKKGALLVSGIGAANWGLSAMNWNLVEMLAGSYAMYVYYIVGAAGVVTLYNLFTSN